MSDSNPVQNTNSPRINTATGVTLEFKDIVKQYPGQKAPAVKKLNLKINAGESVMFVGPSGCGKTTSLKMINRLIEPTSGQILIDGKNVVDSNVSELRRSIGYVIQGGSLLPHFTVAQNIAIVPKLLKWDKKRIAARCDELMEMVGLDPNLYRDRYPRELSGGQQQRVGVARGLAADPPVLLMDEPFGAVDPITRQRLQDELLSIQDELHKTIVCVTHDIDEAIKLGDRIVIFREQAEIAQFDTPEAILSNPADDYVADFVGSGSKLKQLSLLRVDDVGLSDAPTCRVGEAVSEVVAKVESQGEDHVVILDDQDRPQEWLFLRTLKHHDKVPAATHELETVIDRRSTLNNALDTMLMSSHGGAMVTERGRYVGVIRYDDVTDYVRATREEARGVGEDA
ncbi:ABC transporter ATP-binding protein [uncultured Corynebacterium sp.]|uniref:ABC transporter ATP-binding protein n=1 Tax=uncultured Corynebacterium sp. TaxID=159447 RepID=UPI00261B338D|nr:ABC transporter ATP-binding protein [uncultured Corynebacterium sp.]